jgi:hypothetical protein
MYMCITSPNIVVMCLYLYLFIYVEETNSGIVSTGVSAHGD